MRQRTEVDELTYLIREVEQELVDNQRMRDNLLRKHTDLCNYRTSKVIEAALKNTNNNEWSR